jgi:hypothetical protein
MIKASALSVVKDVNIENSMYPSLSCLLRNNQNMIIESAKECEELPEVIVNLALRLLDHDELIKNIINDIRVLYTSKKDEFHIDLSGRQKRDKDLIINLFQDMYGIISFLHYTQENEMLNGKIAFTPKAQAFITGQYLEIAVYRRTFEIIKRLSNKYNKKFKVYKNVRVATREGQMKNEFDLVIEFNGTFYVLEIKSGKNFREFDKYMNIGQEYKIVPNRFLLVDNYLTDEQAVSVEYFCDYYVSNLIGDSLEKKVTLMIENDLNGGYQK